METVSTSVLETQLRQAAKRKQLPPPGLRRAVREAAGVSLDAVAEHCEVSHQTVSYWERGMRTPTGERLERYAELLDRLAKGQGGAA